MKDLAKITRYWGVAVLIVWGGLAIALSLLRFDAYGIDESAARALLINWTVADRVVNPIVTMGAPDFRALIFLPLGAYWPGSFVALKVFMLIITFCAATLLYRWSKEHQGPETALIATGLLLIAPFTLMQINTVGSGPFLLLGFAVAAWLNKTFRASGKQLSGWYFTQILLAITLVSIHPAGLAYPLALAWDWHRDAVSARHKKQIVIGMIIATLTVLLIRFGWPGLSWGINPLITLGDMFLGRVPGDFAPREWSGGLLPAILIAVVMFFARKQILEQFVPRMLALAVILGATAADYGWGLIALAFLLYCGTPLLIYFNSRLGQNSMTGQRGVVMLVLFATTTVFMLGDRSYRSGVINGTLEEDDQIIKALTTETEALEANFLTVSQWPARTMLAIKRPVFPLPPDTESPEQLLEMLGKVNFIIFDPMAPENKSLRDNLAALNTETETLIQQPNGVIVKMRNNVIREE